MAWQVWLSIVGQMDNHVKMSKCFPTSRTSLTRKTSQVPSWQRSHVRKAQFSWSLAGRSTLIWNTWPVASYWYIFHLIYNILFSVWRLDVKASAPVWTLMPGKMPRPRRRYATTLAGTDVFLYGGESVATNDNIEAKYPLEVDIYYSSEDSWETPPVKIKEFKGSMRFGQSIDRKIGNRVSFLFF